jgi:hypothetical protein
MDQRSFPQSATLAATTARNLSSRSTPHGVGSGGHVCWRGGDAALACVAMDDR